MSLPSLSPGTPTGHLVFLDILKYHQAKCSAKSGLLPSDPAVGPAGIMWHPHGHVRLVQGCADTVPCHSVRESVCVGEREGECVLDGKWFSESQRELLILIGMLWVDDNYMVAGNIALCLSPLTLSAMDSQMKS